MITFSYVCIYCQTQGDKVPHRRDQSYEQYLNASCVIVQRPHTHPSARPPALTHAAAHFLGHLFLRLFQLLEEFACQIGRIPTPPSKVPHTAICLWSLNGVFCVHTGLLFLLLIPSVRFSCSPRT